MDQPAALNRKVPKYWTTADEIKNEIARGALQPGDRIPSHNEMRARFGISRTTVDKVHSLLEKEGLIIREQGRGTFVATRGKVQKSNVVGLSGRGFPAATSSYYWSELFQGAYQFAESKGFELVLIDRNSPDMKLAGILSGGWPLPEEVQRLRMQIPCVSVIYPVESMASVFVDDFEACRSAAAYLVSLNHRRIAYVHSQDRLLVPKRMGGYRAALEAAGISPLPQWTRSLASPPESYNKGTYFTRDGYDTMLRWLKEDWNSLGCTAILAHNDETAIGVMQALREAGLRIPQDISVVGYDGMEICDFVTPRLATIELPLRQLGASAMQLLMQRIASGELGVEHRVLPTVLRQRESAANCSSESQK